ncbi:hypothetical protein [Caenibacillus caldisaponilyticus]|jgi:hypothetical protein|uniref:hypothetical protein n=1 Tax=Caenibacillus caldisaponilyticus TaxID=1674942 RepID=UPI000988687D|nr:hypothetical protein [Caenibacillus caldisaponilyticus]
MEKKRYYITVGSGEILPEKTLSEWEFEIDATEAEVHELEKLFRETDEESWENYWRAHIPFMEYDEKVNEGVDDQLRRVYAMIYRLGTEETKAHIRSMNIL